MNELIKVNYDSDRPTLSGRELHEFLEVETRYNDWFTRMCEYGFVENIDFYSFLSKSTGGRPSQSWVYIRGADVKGENISRAKLI